MKMIYDKTAYGSIHSVYGVSIHIRLWMVVFNHWLKWYTIQIAKKRTDVDLLTFSVVSVPKFLIDNLKSSKLFT